MRQGMVGGGWGGSLCHPSPQQASKVPGVVPSCGVSVPPVSRRAPRKVFVGPLAPSVLCVAGLSFSGGVRLGASPKMGEPVARSCHCGVHGSVRAYSFFRSGRS